MQMEVHELAFGETSKRWLGKMNVRGVTSQPFYLSDLTAPGHQDAINAIESFLCAIFAGMRPIMPDMRAEAERARAVRISRWQSGYKVMASACINVKIQGEIIQMRATSEQIKHMAETTDDLGLAAALQLAGREIASAISTPQHKVKIENMLCGERARTWIDDAVAELFEPA